MGSPRPGHLTILNFLESGTLIASLRGWREDGLNSWGESCRGKCSAVLATVTIVSCYGAEASVTNLFALCSSCLNSW